MSLQIVKFRAMGSPCSVRVFAPSLVQAAEQVKPCIAEIERLEQIYSRYKASSELSQLNATAGKGPFVVTDLEMASLLDFALQAWEQSDQLFDITSGVLRRVWDFSSGVLPTQAKVAEVLCLVGMDKISWQKPNLTLPLQGMELDFGGCVKEYAADAAAKTCRAQGISSGMVELGGDVAVIGPRPGGEPWRVGIRKPHSHSTQALAYIGLSEGAMASSGDYERYLDIEGRRYSHILSPKTGWPVASPAHVSVIAGNCLVAGTVSTVAMLKGEAGCMEWLDSIGLPYYVVLQSGCIVNRL